MAAARRRDDGLVVEEGAIDGAALDGGDPQLRFAGIDRGIVAQADVAAAPVHIGHDIEDAGIAIDAGVVAKAHAAAHDAGVGVAGDAGAGEIALGGAFRGSPALAEPDSSEGPVEPDLGPAIAEVGGAAAALDAAFVVLSDGEAVVDADFELEGGAEVEAGGGAGGFGDETQARGAGVVVDVIDLALLAVVGPEQGAVQLTGDGESEGRAAAPTDAVGGGSSRCSY